LTQRLSKRGKISFAKLMAAPAGAASAVGELSATGTDVSVAIGALVAVGASVSVGRTTTSVAWEAGVAGLAQADNNPTITSRTKTFTFLETIY
jgi:hypothetical protein